MGFRELSTEDHYVDRHSRTALGQRNEIFKEGDEEGEKKPKKLLDKTRLFQTISQPRIYLQTDFFFIKRPSDNNKKNMDQLHFYAPVQQISLPFLVDTFQGSNKTRDGLDTDKSPSYRCGY